MAKVMIILLILSLLIGVFQFQRKNMTVMLGMSLAFAIVLSLTATLGTLFPLVVFTPEKLNSPGARLLFLALGSIVLGIILCAWAGAKREAAAASEESGTPAAFWASSDRVRPFGNFLSHAELQFCHRGAGDSPGAGSRYSRHLVH